MSNKCIFIIFTLLALCGCTGERCIDADDFGHAVFNVEARYDRKDFDGQVGESQVAKWLDSAYRVNGRPLTVVVRGWENGLDGNNKDELSAWCAWYGTSEDSGKLAEFCRRFPDCKFIGNEMCTPELPDANIMNAPCLFRKGVGLYALIVEPDVDPNISFSSMRDPKGISFHVGAKVGDYSLYEIDKRGRQRELGGRVYKYESQDIKRRYADGKLYFKILDKFYDDNSGQYKVIVKSGISRTNPDPISYVTRLVKNFLFGNGEDYGIIRKIYLGVVHNPGYRLAVSALLTLYVMYTGLSYLAGNIQVTHTEIIVRVCKIAIVAALLSSEYSWSFFNDYLFVYFIGGVEQILQMITDAGATGPGSPGILALMMAPQTMSKLLSLLFIDWRGFIYIILFFIALYFVLMVFFEATVLYLTALMAIGMIIVMGPVFICFMLFGVTRSLFENWLKQLISYAVQPIILFTGLIFISLILRQEIYGALGFRVCKQDFPKMTNDDGSSIFGSDTKEILGFDMGSSIFYWWFPQPMKGEQFSKDPILIPIPMDHFDEAGKFCEAYGCEGKRFIDLPFLDPKKDTRRLGQFHSGKFVQFDGLLLIFVAIYLLYKFNALTVSLARFITNTSGNYTKLDNVGDAIRAQTVDKVNQRMLAKLKERGAIAAAGVAAVGRRAGIKVMDTVLGEKSSKYYREKYIKSPSKLVDQMRISRLKKEALSANANKAVLEEVRKKTGLVQSNIKKGAIQNYKDALQKKLLASTNKSLPETDKDKIARQKVARQAAVTLSKKPFAELKQELSKIKFGKEYSKLSKVEKEQIDATHRELRESAKDSSEARKFREAYVDAYAALSDRGVGLVGKKVKVLRSVEEIQHDHKQRKEIRDAKRQQIGEEIISGYQGIKSGLYKSAMGQKDDTISRTFAGGAWHEINTDPKAENHRKQTYAEILEDRQQHIERVGTQKTIDDYSKAYKTSVISPEFLANASITNDPKLATFRRLEREDVRAQVYNALSTTEDPALLGKTYMQEYAKDSEMRHAIDRAYKLEQELLNDDKFISREENYQATFDLAVENIQQEYQKLTDLYNKDDISVEEMPSLLYGSLPLENNETREQRQERAAKLQQSIQDFHNSQQALQQVDIRKKEVAEEVDKHVDNINEYRVKAKMEEYSPKRSQVGVRKMTKIDDYNKRK